MNMSESGSELLRAALASSPLARTNSLTHLRLGYSELSSDVRIDVSAMENFSIAINVAHGLFDLMQNASSLRKGLETRGIDSLVVEKVKVQFVHPDEGLIIIETALLPIVASSAALAAAIATAESVATVSTVVVAAVATSVAAAVAGSVGGAVAGAAGGAAGGGAAGGGAGGGGGGGGGAGGVMPLMFGAQRLEMSAGIAAPKSEIQTGVADGLGWAGGDFGFISEPTTVDGRRLEGVGRPKALTGLLSSLVSLCIGLGGALLAQLIAFFYWKCRANQAYYEHKKQVFFKVSSNLALGEYSSKAFVSDSDYSSKVRQQPKRRPRQQLRRKSSIDGKIKFKKYPIMFVFPSLFLVVYKLFVTGLNKSAATLLATPGATCDTTCRALASTVLTVSGVYVLLGWLVLLDFDIRFREDQWKTSNTPSSVMKIDDPFYRGLSMLRARIFCFGDEDPRSILKRMQGKFAKPPNDTKGLRRS